MGAHALIGGLAGGIGPLLALAAASAPLGAILVGGGIAILGGIDLYNTVNIIRNEFGGQLTWCTGIRAALDVAAIVFGGIIAWRGVIGAWSAGGSLLKWAASPATSAALEVGGINLGEYNPLPNRGTAFSAVYDPESGQMLMRPSGDTLLANGDIPVGRVPRAGGHALVNAALGSLGVDTMKTVGFTVFYEQPNALTVEWLSRSVNAANYGVDTVPLQFRPSIIAIFERLGLAVTSR